MYSSFFILGNNFDLIQNTMEISKKAVEKLKERVATADACGVRLKLKPAGCSGYKYDLSYVYEQPKWTDVLCQDILYVDISSLPFLEKVKIEWEQSILGEEFVFINPLETTRCGCGESFHME